MADLCHRHRAGSRTRTRRRSTAGSSGCSSPTTSPTRPTTSTSPRDRYAPSSSTASSASQVRATDDPDLVDHVDGPIVYKVRHSAGTEWQVLVPSPGPYDWADLLPPARSPGIVIPTVAPDQR